LGTSPASPVDYLEFPIATLKVGALGTHNALGLAKAKGARFFIASTSEVYGDPLEHPQTEKYWGNVNPIGPRGVYDEAKRFAEAMTMAYHRFHGMDTRIVRIFNTYGPRMRPHDGRVVSNFIVQALGNEPLAIAADGDVGANGQRPPRPGCCIDLRRDLFQQIGLRRCQNNTRAGPRQRERHRPAEPDTCSGHGDDRAVKVDPAYHLVPSGGFSNSQR